jgi:hypothetical protein
VRLDPLATGDQLVVICAKYADSEQVSYLAVDDWQQALDLVLAKGRPLLSLLLLAEDDLLPEAESDSRT